MTERSISPELLAALLDQNLPPGRSSLPPLMSDPLVNTAAGLARLKLPPLSPRASTRIEGRLLTEFDTQLGRRRTARSQQSAVFGLWRWALIATVLFVLLAGALTPAVAASVPGDPLYPVKRLYERAELALAASPSAQAAVNLWHANRRTQEALVLLERSQFDPGLIDAALSDIDAASKLPDEVRSSLQLRAELLQVQKLMAFVLNSARLNGLTTQSDILPRVQRVQELSRSELLLPLPALEHNPNAAADTETPTLTPTPTSSPFPDALAATPTCASGRSCRAPGQAVLASLTPTCAAGKSCLAPGQATQAPLVATCETGKSCLSHGTPGATSTPRPPHIPPTRQPTHVPPTRQPTQATGGNASNQGNASGNRSSGGGGSNGNNGGSNSGENGAKNNGKP